MGVAGVTATERLEATVLSSSRSFVRLGLPDPWAPTTIPLREAGLDEGQVVAVQGHADPELDQVRAPSPGGAMKTFPGFRVLVVEIGGDAPRTLEVAWPMSAPEPAKPAVTAAATADEDDWSDV